MMLFLRNNLIYPNEAKDLGIQGRCYVQFIVSATGKITSPKILRGVSGCPECDQECLRVIRLMPDWIPARVNNKPVNSYYQIPFTFKMN
jgi:protein TonB